MAGPKAPPTFNWWSAGRTRRRELRPHREGESALSPRAESAFRRDREREIDRGGCARIADGGADFGGDGERRSGTGAGIGNLRDRGDTGIDPTAGGRGNRDRGQRTPGGARDFG